MRVIADLFLLGLTFLISRVIAVLDLRNMFLEIRAQREKHAKEGNKKPVTTSVEDNKKGE